LKIARLRPFAALARAQARFPFVFLTLAFVMTALAALSARRLELRTGFESLLPENRASVVELARVAEKTSGVSTLFVVLQGRDGTDAKTLRARGDAVVKEVLAIGAPYVGSAEDGVHDGYGFLTPRAGLFADRAALEKLRDDVDARFDYEVSKSLGTQLEDAPPPAIDEARVRATFGLGEASDRYPDGYYQSADGRVVVVAIRSKVLASDVPRATETIARVRSAVERAGIRAEDPSITYGLAGDLYSGLAEYRAVIDDLTDVGYVGGALIAAVVFLYYLRLRTLFAMVVTIGVGVAWTFGFTRLSIGHLNVATGFLFSIVAGNGINFGILFMARYLEARRARVPSTDAIAVAHDATWRSTLTACLAASAAYATLATTEFRGFRDFGVIGGVGMILCWLATYLTLPPLLVALERVLPLNVDAGAKLPGFFGRLAKLTSAGVPFGRPFAALVERAPHVVLITGLALALVGGVGLTRYVASDPMEYDLLKLRNEMKLQAEEKRNKELADRITGFVGADGMALLVDRPEHVAPLRTALLARRDAAPKDARPFDDLVALEDLVPKDQAAKIPTLLALKEKLSRAKRRSVIDAATWNRVERFLPPDDLAPFTMADLPADVARPFTELDGTRGRIVYIVPSHTDSTDDAHYLLRWADSYRRTELPDGSVVIGSGRAVIYADMWEAVVAAVPSSVALSFAATVLVVVLAFRGRRAAVYVLGALAVGALWMAGAFVVAGVKINFLNFIALPITFGIGVDYAVNIVGRYVREGGARAALEAVRETGGAVILCSATTTLGYLALVRSMNLGVRSLGVAAVIGEVTCLLAAVLVLPAALVLIDRRVARGRAITGDDGRRGAT
jgi:hypothetical protein